MWTVHFYDYSLGSLLAYFVLYFITCAWTSGLAVPSGTFFHVLVNLPLAKWARVGLACILQCIKF